ncbi:hypothetical protein DUNSADRAFT_14648 [Dunaliella salina]|uniref:Uncharacterized protein n=1 Tax=Dunaliella salina TaxID=3046 RepID=A0ABQ7G757_DUNSA|nr:hypothetical protein DUNSADRAFT_14648 [Dunaliella salina]|eukprot:KAF5830404.1 hypothetical protein DUNSADRAFT_14648 [Dunaliella salina]
MSHSNPSPSNPNTVVVRPDLMSSEAELRDVLPHYTGHLAPSLQQAVTQQLLDEAQNRRITKGDLPSLISALILRLFRPESASEGFNWDSGDQSSTHSLPMHSSSSTHCLSRPLSSSPRSSHDALSQQHPSRHWHSDSQHPTAPAAAAGAAYLPYPPIAIPAPVGPPLRDSPRSSLRRARVTAMQEALMKHSNFQGHGQQQQHEQQHGRSMASPAHKMNPAESLRRSRTFMEVMKTASAANSTSSSSGISDTVEGPYRGHDRSSSSSNFAGSASTGNSPVPAAKPRLPVHTRTRSPDELPFKMPKHWPAQTHSPLARAPPHTQASSTALPPNLELPRELPTIPGPLGSLQVASTTPTASSSPKSWESPAPPATPSPPVIRTPSPPPAPPQSTRARSPPSPSSMEPTQTAAPPPPPTTTRPTHRPHFPGEATSVEAARAPSSGLTRASSGSFDQRSLDEFKGLGPRNSSGSDLCSPLTLVASDIDGSNKEGKDKQRAGRKSVGFALQASDGSFTSRDSPCTSPGPSSTPVSPCSTPLLSQSCRKASALKGRGSVGDGQGTVQGDGTPLRRCVSFAVPQSMASDDGDDDNGDGQAKPCRPLASRHRSSEPGRSSRRSRRHHHQCRHQHEGGGREAFEEGDRGSGRHRASDTGFAQGQGPCPTEAERCSRGRDASRPSTRRHSTPTEGSDTEQGRSLTSSATGGSFSISMELSKRKANSISQHGHIEGGMQGNVQPQQEVLFTKTEHDANTASTAAAAAGEGDGAPRQQPVSTSAASCRQGVREAGGGVTSGTGQGSEGGGSDDSSNSEEVRAWSDENRELDSNQLETLPK